VKSQLTYTFSDPTAIRRPALPRLCWSCSSDNFPDFKVKIQDHQYIVRPSPRLFTSSNAQTVFMMIDYSSYVPRRLRDAQESNKDEVFEGLIHHIYFQSGNRYNTREIGIGYSGIQPKSDIANLLNCHTTDVYESGNGPGQCISITFRSIRVRPLAFAVRSGPLTLTRWPLTSYVLHGWDPLRRIWVVLYERRSVLEFPTWTASQIAYIDTNMEFSEFRLIETEQPRPGTHFSIQAMEIHGNVREMDEIHPRTLKGNDCEIDGVV
jgi:hypothetical protein